MDQWGGGYHIYIYIDIHPYLYIFTSMNTSYHTAVWRYDCPENMARREASGKHIPEDAAFQGPRRSDLEQTPILVRLMLKLHSLGLGLRVRALLSSMALDVSFFVVLLVWLGECKHVFLG